MGRSGLVPPESQSFPVVLETLISFMQRYPIPPWSNIEVIEDPTEIEDKPTSRVPAETFDPRFQQIMDLRLADWVNVGAVEVVDGVLLVKVRYRSMQIQDRTDVRFLRSTISVNLHGPTREAFARMGIDADEYLP